MSALAKEIGRTSKELIEWLNNNGEYVKTPSSTVEAAVVAKVYEAFPRRMNPFAQSRSTSISSSGQRPPDSQGPRPQPLSEHPTRPAPTAVPDDLGDSSALPRPVGAAPALGKAAGAAPLTGPRVTPDDGLVHTLSSMSRWPDIADFIRTCARAQREQRPLIVDLADCQPVWPNACVPIAAILQKYRADGLAVAIRNETHFLKNTSFRNPVVASESNLRSRRLVNSVWVYFDENEAIALTNELIRMLQKTVEMEDGVLEALNFCLFEVLDNVFQHSESDSGYLMAVLHGGGQKLALAIADTGIGVFNSFKGSQYDPPTHFDALTLAVQAGVTSTGDKRGNGLFALRGTVEQNAGSLTLRSGPGVLTIRGSSASGRDYPSTPVIGQDSLGFFLDWQLDLKQPVSLHSVLGMPVGNLHLERLENEEGDHVVRICDHDAGTGTRKAAEQLRLYLLNILHEGAPRVTLDFDGVVVVSASFADEVIGKLAEQFGPLQFFSKFPLTNMTPTIESLLDRAIRLRIAQEPPPAITR